VSDKFIMNDLNNIYKEYFDFLEKYFLPLYREAEKNGITSEQLARDVKKSTRLFDSLVKITPTIVKFIEDFWERNHERVFKTYTSLPGLKTRFGGDIGPQDFEKIIEKVGLYFDTIIVPDPILRVATLPATEETKSFYLLKYAINQLHYKKAFITKTEPLIAILLPDRELVGVNKFNYSELANYGSVDSVIILNSLYNKKLNSFEEAQQFLQKFKDIDEAYKEIVKPDIIWWDENEPRDVFSQLESIKKQQFNGLLKGDFPYEVKDPRYLLFQLTGRLTQINDVLVRGNEINASPLISAPVSYHWLKVKILENQKFFLKGNHNNLNLGLTNSFLSNKNEWLGNITIDDLISIRDKGIISDLRKDLTSEIKLLGELSINDIDKITSHVDYNLNNLLKRHLSELEKIQKQFRNELLLKGPTFLTSLTVSLQPLLGNFLPAWTAAVGSIVGFSTLTDIFSCVKDFLSKNKMLKQAPVGILWSAKKQNK